jgi:hypothetical protein
MNRSVYRLLKGYLMRSAPLYAVVGVVQFIMTGFFWSWGYGRMPIVGVMLGVWGAIAAINHRSLVWRSLPLTSQDVSVFRWWAIAGAPGIYLTLLSLIAWVSQRSSRFPTPAAATILEGILAAWAMLGVLAVVARGSGWPSSKFRKAKIIGSAAGAVCLLAYGVPVGPASRPYDALFVGAGMILLLFSAERARRGLDWRWPDLAGRSSRFSGGRPFASTHHYGLSAVLIPLAQHTAIFAAVATVIIVSLQQVFPRASMVLFWGYFVGLSTAGFLLTYRGRMAFQALRCLPLSAKQLAGLLQLFGALPGLATLGLTLLINRVVLNARLDIGLVSGFALLTIASQVFPVAQTLATAPQNKLFSYWLPLFQRLWVPFWLVLTVAGWSDAYGRFGWFRWPLQAGGIVLCIVGYIVLVQQLRSGIRPSSNENAFS